ncbi:ABC transporter ATP-binding protein [Rhizobium leguminosarum]|uniref:ABC transporter ATP-binding protein n=1 Tax=Rhizobium leguminosarum TaxID=384 RepID=UPI0010321A2C|nr:ABC transporter ATP-binding protein [Rhizobium leguminosarum]TBC86595.1 ABC transporter ATP-binding protein [Rhizobium leguminosarum]
MNQVNRNPDNAVGSQPIASFRSVSKRYDSNCLVVDDLDLDIVRGEFLTLLGPSGSGKTTTLMMLAGFEWPTSGNILMDGDDITGLPPYLRDMGVVFQSYALFPHMTIAENIEFPLAVRKIAPEERRRRVAEALDLVHLGSYANRYPIQLSGGQQQRVALARSLVYRPRMVLMDEPLGALDKALREQMQLEIKQIHQQMGITFVYVTHDQDEALTMSDRVAVFHQGKIQQITSPVEIYKRPRNRFVATFLGETNTLEGLVTQCAEGFADIQLSCGSILRGRAGEGVVSGAKAALMVRPESIGVKGGPGNGLRGRLVDQHFHGDHIRLHVALDGGQALQLKVKPQEGAELRQSGETVAMTIQEEDALILL